MEESATLIEKVRYEYLQNGCAGVFRKIRSKVKKFLFYTNCSIWYSKSLIRPIEKIVIDKTIDLHFLEQNKNEIIEWLKENKNKFPASYFEKEVESAIKNNHVFAVLKNHGEIIGFLKVGIGPTYIHDFDKTVQFPDRVAFIYDTFILPGYRGNNLAQFIVSSASEYFAQKEFKNIFCHIESWNVPSVKTFKKADFYEMDSIRFVRILRCSFFLKNRFSPFYDLEKYLNRKAANEQA